jgi:2-dehydropantoate 2-reductase
MGDGTAVVSLQNGVENEEKLARAVGEDHVMGGAAFIFAGVAEPGVIVHSGGPASITFGELDGRATQRARCLLAWCERAGFQAELSASISTVLWAKLAFICAQAGLTAAVRLPIGEIRTVDVAWAAFKRLVAEVCAVAEADGSPVPQAAQDSALALAQAIEPGSFSSLHDDLVAGRRMELEALHGFVVRRAAQHALAAPTLEAVYAILQPWAVRTKGAGSYALRHRLYRSSGRRAAEIRHADEQRARHPHRCSVASGPGEPRRPVRPHRATCRQPDQPCAGAGGDWGPRSRTRAAGRRYGQGAAGIAAGGRHSEEDHRGHRRGRAGCW